MEHERRARAPKKSLGQHFLTSPGALGKMIEAGDLSAADTVLEIGPGRGALTARLLETGAKVVAVEKDESLAAELSERFSREMGEGRLSLVRGDILDASVLSGAKLPDGFKVVANIPYYITGEILRMFLSGRRQPSRAALLVQREVAERIVAEDKKESVLSISVKCYGTPRFAGAVKAGSFFPKPKVDSAILEISDISRDFFNDIDEGRFFDIVKAGFAHKRKLLRGNLRAVAAAERVDGAFAACGIDMKARPEDVPLSKWKLLARELR